MNVIKSKKAVIGREYCFVRYQGIHQIKKYPLDLIYNFGFPVLKYEK